MWSKVGFERVGQFEELWPAFCRAAARFGAYAPSELRQNIQPEGLLAELQRASCAASDRAVAEGGNACVAGFDVCVQGRSLAVTFGSGRSIVYISPYSGKIWSLAVGSRTEDVDSCLESIRDRWKATGFPLPR